MTRVALVTWRGLPELTADDRLLADALRARGATVESAIWDDGAVRWNDFDRVVVRSTWDYHTRLAEFGAWIDAMESAAVPLWNPPTLLRRNVHKSYLLELAWRGVPIAPTELVRVGSQKSLGEVRAARGWRRVVVKPAVSATAYRTLVDPDEAEFAALVADVDVLVQPFLDEVSADGEWSLIFLGGQFSHAVLKRARNGDFRVQSDFGGSATAIDAPASLIAQAAAIMARVDGPWLYGRVDGVVQDGTFVLMELELTEPSLFLDLHRGAPARMADAVMSKALAPL